MAASRDLIYLDTPLLGTRRDAATFLIKLADGCRRCWCSQALGEVPGYSTEDNIFCITAHYRRVRPAIDSSSLESIFEPAYELGARQSRHHARCGSGTTTLRMAEPPRTMSHGTLVPNLYLTCTLSGAV